MSAPNGNEARVRAQQSAEAFSNALIFIDRHFVDGRLDDEGAEHLFACALGVAECLARLIASGDAAEVQAAIVHLKGDQLREVAHALIERGYGSERWTRFVNNPSQSNAADAIALLEAAHIAVNSRLEAAGDTADRYSPSPPLRSIGVRQETSPAAVTRLIRQLFLVEGHCRALRDVWTKWRLNAERARRAGNRKRRPQDSHQWSEVDWATMHPLRLPRDFRSQRAAREKSFRSQAKDPLRLDELLRRETEMWAVLEWRAAIESARDALAPVGHWMDDIALPRAEQWTTRIRALLGRIATICDPVAHGTSLGLAAASGPDDLGRGIEELVTVINQLLPVRQAPSASGTYLAPPSEHPRADAQRAPVEEGSPLPVGAFAPMMKDLAIAAGISDDTFRRVCKAAGLERSPRGAGGRKRRFGPDEVDRLIEAARNGNYYERTTMIEQWSPWSRNFAATLPQVRNIAAS